MSPSTIPTLARNLACDHTDHLAPNRGVSRDQATSISSSHASACPRAEHRPGASCPIRFTSADRETVRMLSQFAAQHRGSQRVGNRPIAYSSAPTRLAVSALLHGLRLSVHHRVEIADLCCQLLNLVHFFACCFGSFEEAPKGFYTLPINTKTSTTSRTMPSPPLG
jgi:hypothetical protein